MLSFIPGIAGGLNFKNTCIAESAPDFIESVLGEVLHAYLKEDTDPVKILDHLQEAYRRSYRKSK